MDITCLYIKYSFQTGPRGKLFRIHASPLIYKTDEGRRQSLFDKRLHNSQTITLFVVYWKMILNSGQLDLWLKLTSYGQQLLD